jgi:hypothetical protein
MSNPWPPELLPDDEYHLIGAARQRTTGGALARYATDANGNVVGFIGPRGEILGGAVDVRAFSHLVVDGDWTAAINAAGTAFRDGALLIPPGTYRLDGDVTLTLKGHNPNAGAFVIEATGAVFTGAGKLVIDSCKRVQINGLDMPTKDLVFRGAWWCSFSNMRFCRLVLSDAAGSNFSANYWNRFEQCQFQAVIHSAAATQPSNEFVFASCSIRGSADQAFAQTAAHAFEFLGNQNCQSWKMDGGDVSYHTTAVYTIGGSNTTGEVALTFSGVYFDTLLPTPIARQRTVISTRGCHNANANSYDGTFSAMTCGEFDLVRDNRLFRSDGSTGVNLIPNGDFRAQLSAWVGAGLPIAYATGATVTSQSGGPGGTYLNINNPATSGNAAAFRSISLPFPGRLSAVVVLRNAAAGTKTVTLGVANTVFPPCVITDTDWTVPVCTTSSIIAAGAAQDLLIYTNDSTR